MNILLLGSGGREHALTWKIKQSPLCSSLYVAPGNAGTADLATNVPVPSDNFIGIKQICLNKKIDLIIAGPELPLVKGLRNFLESDDELKHVKLVGPDKQGAMLEGSKDFAKQFMERYEIPTAAYKTFTNENCNDAQLYLKNHTLPIVVKADGLASGKGVIISENADEAYALVCDIIQHERFGDAGNKVVIEQFLTGIEISVFIITDGKNYKILPEAKDYKRIGEGDTGPNTGGMGAVSPVVFADEAFMFKVEEKIIKRTMQGLNAEGIDYKGFIFFGLMNVQGEPYVIEYNCRMGDPESEVVIPRIDSDIVELFLATVEDRLDNFDLKISDKAAATVMLVAGGYPDEYETGKVIHGLENVAHALPFQAGTIVNARNQLVTNGGRVIAVTGVSDNIAEAIHLAYNEIEKIQWDNMYFRKDIGRDLLSLDFN